MSICNTLVIQSHRSPLPYPWIQRCLASVSQWCVLNGYEYRFIGNELFDCLPPALNDRRYLPTVVASDLARLLTLNDALNEGYETVVWLDADFLIFNFSEFAIPDQPYALGREVWVQNDKNDKLKVYKKIHNAFLMFRRGNSFLSFYAETAERLLLLNQGAMPPQFIGPKLLSALHNVAQLPVMETAGMLSPMVIHDVIHTRGPALNLFLQHSVQDLAGANLCVSSCESNDVSEREMELLIDALVGGALTKN